MSTTQAPSPTKVVTGEVRLSYASLWEPSAAKGSTELKYNTVVLVPKSDVKTVAKLKAAIAAAEAEGREKFGNKWKPSGKNPPLKDGDIEKPEDAAYAGHYSLSAKSKTQPSMIDRKGNRIVEKDQIYSGVYAFVSLSFFPYSNVDTGVGIGLNNIMKSKDGDPFAGRASAEEDFADLIGSASDEDFL